MSADVTIIDYGVGNLFSVQRSLEHCGARVIISTEPDVIRSAQKVVLPGVGAFGDAMQELERQGLATVVRDVAAAGTPLLGICLGMQLLLDESQEFGRHQGLGIIPGRVVPVPAIAVDRSPQKIPHIGWASLVPAEGRAHWQDGLLADVDPGDAVYFVHSYMAQTAVSADRVADALYGGHRIAGVIRRKNVVGCQFHPEKSGRVGLSILRAFCTASG